MRAPLVYLVGGGKVHALELANGRQRWEANAGAGSPGLPGSVTAGRNWGQPIADGDLLLRASSAGILRRYVPRSGYVVWQRTAGLYASEPVMADERLYVSQDETLEAYSARTGQRLWRRWFACHLCGAATAGGRVYAAGAPDGEVGDPSGLFAIDGKTGATVWAANTRAMLTWFSAPVLADGKVLVRTENRAQDEVSIDAFRASDGKHLWHSRIGAVSGLTPIAANATVVVTVSKDGFLSALDAETGAVRWRHGKMSNAFRPVIINGLIWAETTKHQLAAFDARDGNELWTSSAFTSELLGSAVVAANLVLLATSDGRLLAYHVGR